MVEVVVPRAGACPYRTAAWDWLRDLWKETYPDWTLTEAHAGDDPWCKATTIAPVVEASTAEILVVADADVWVPELAAAVAAVEGGAPWAVPHREIRRFSETASAEVLAGQPIAEVTDLAQEPYPCIPGGGVVVVPRLVALAVPLDTRYVGWGQEDASWGMALATLAGEPWRGGDSLLHLWHPPQQRLDRKRGSHASWALRGRYADALHDPAAMSALIEESRVTQQSLEHPRDDPPPQSHG